MLVMQHNIPKKQSLQPHTPTWSRFAPVFFYKMLIYKKFK